jgi:hypothetical protein
VGVLGVRCIVRDVVVAKNSVLIEELPEKGGVLSGSGPESQKTEFFTGGIGRGVVVAKNSVLAEELLDKGVVLSGSGPESQKTEFFTGGRGRGGGFEGVRDW